MDPEQPVPDTVHVTPVLVAPVTFAVNCCVFPSLTCAEVGEIPTATAWTMVTVALLDFVESAEDVAVTVTNEGFGICAGAV